MKLKNKVAIVTGGSRGIGKVVAEFLTREGARVILMARDRAEIAQALREIELSAGAKPFGVAVDVSDFTAVKRAVRAVGKKFHCIDILVNAAGIQAPIGEFIDNDISAWEKNIAVNLFGVVHMCKATLPFMVKSRSGSIINFSGGGATSSRSNFSAYAVAKIGVVKFTETLADELLPYHIKVNAIAPGAVNTAMLKEVLKAGARAGKKEIAEAKQRAKEGGASPELAAALVVFLASRDSDGLTGRLISAPWDDWKHWDKKTIKNLGQTEALKLRRLGIQK